MVLQGVRNIGKTDLRPTCIFLRSPSLDRLEQRNTDTEQSLAAARADLQRLKNVKVCPDCGHENQPNANFCAHCSAKLPELPKPEPAVGGFCPGCGAPLGPNDHFCGKCGARLD